MPEISEKVVLESVVLEKSHENEEMYLKAIYLLEELGLRPVHAIDVAKLLKISLPSCVEMLNKLDKKKFISYNGRNGIQFKGKGKKLAEKIIRNFRLTELLFRDILKLDFEDDSVCRFEHVVTDKIAIALRKVLNNPHKCRHGKNIPVY